MSSGKRSPDAHSERSASQGLDKAPGRSDGATSESAPTESDAVVADGKKPTDQQAGAVDEPRGDLDEAADVVQADIDAIVSERDQYLALAQRVQADFENFRKRMLRQGANERDKGVEALVEKLLPVFDAFDAALTHDDAKKHVRPLYDALMSTLEKAGLALQYPVGEVFDANFHEAVAHEESAEQADGAPEGDDADNAGPVVTEVLRPGYAWLGRVLRPAMVKVKS